MMRGLRSGHLSAAVAAIGAMTASAAGAQSMSYLDVGAAAGYSTNPYLDPDDSDGSAFGRIFITGQHSRATARTVTSLSAYAEQAFYGGDNDSSRLASVNGSVRHRASETLDVYGLLGGTVDSGGQLFSRFIDFPQGPGPVPAPVVPGSGTAQPASVQASVPASASAQVPVLPVPGFGTDPAFIGFRENQYSVHGLVGASFKMGPRDSLNVQAGARHSWFGGDDSEDYTSYSLGGGWDHVLSERTVIGAGIDSQWVDYGDSGNAVILSPHVRVRTLLAENWVANAALGASIVDDADDNGDDIIDDDSGDGRSVGLYVNGSLCRSMVASTFCARLHRNALPSADGGIVNATTAGLNYARRLTVNDSVQASANLVRYSGGGMLANSVTSFATADIGYNRRLSGRIWSSAQVGARLADRRAAESATDLNASVAIRYRFGDAM